MDYRQAHRMVREANPDLTWDQADDLAASTLNAAEAMTPLLAQAEVVRALCDLLRPEPEPQPEKPVIDSIESGVNFARKQRSVRHAALSGDKAGAVKAFRAMARDGAVVKDAADPIGYGHPGLWFSIRVIERAWPLAF